MSLHGSEVLETKYGDKTLYFSPLEHKYHLGQMELVSVTRYLKAAGYTHGFNGDNSRAEFGRYVHEATALLDMDDLEIERLDMRLIPYVRAWERFKAEQGFVPDMTVSERPIFHPVYLYAGMPDRAGTLKGKPCVVEIKSGVPERWHHVQCGGAYTPMLAAHYPQYKGADSLIVYLKDDGSYKPEPVTDKKLPSLFLSITACVNGRTLYGPNADIGE